VLSPYTAQIEADGIAASLGVDYVLLNGSFRRPYHLFLADWDPGVVDILKQKLAPLSRDTRPMYEAGGCVLYELGRDESPDDRAWFPVLPFSRRPGVQLAPCERDVAGALRVTGLGVPRSEALAGDTLTVVIAYLRESSPPSELPFVVRMRLDRSGEAHRSHAIRETARVLKRIRGRASDHVLLHKPFSGMYTPEMWPIGLDVYETIRVHLPRGLEEGRYHLQLDIGYQSPSRNGSIASLVDDSREHTNGSCADVQVRHFLTR
jgi:hypothetical protein